MGKSLLAKTRAEETPMNPKKGAASEQAKIPVCKGRANKAIYRRGRGGREMGKKEGRKGRIMRLR